LLMIRPPPRPPLFPYTTLFRSLRAMGGAPVYHREAVRTLERLRQTAEDLGGSLVIERAPAEIKNEIDSWGSFGSTTDLMKRIKNQLDPENMLSPGRFFA